MKYRLDPPSPKKPPRRYAATRGGLVKTLPEMATAEAHHICREVSKRSRLAEVPKIVEECLLDLLSLTFEAGVRQGHAEKEAEVETVIRNALETALKGVANHVPSALCPHCVGGRTDYGDCEECGGKGRFKKT